MIKNKHLARAKVTTGSFYREGARLVNWLHMEKQEHTSFCEGDDLQSILLSAEIRTVDFKILVRCCGKETLVQPVFSKGRAIAAIVKFINEQIKPYGLFILPKDLGEI